MARMASVGDDERVLVLEDTLGDGEARKAYDLLFLCTCLSVSDTALQRMVAYVYYVLVRLFGWAFYRYNR